MRKAIKRGIALWLAVLLAGLALLYINTPQVSAAERRNMIDVSSWQGDINWDHAAASGIDYAIIRVCAGTREDTKWEQNYTGATEAGIQVGVYLYNYATTVEGAQAEAQALLDALDGRELDLPVYYDLEYSRVAATGRDNIRELANTFLAAVSAEGYDVGIYCNVNWYRNHIDHDNINTDLYWIASYGTNDGYMHTRPSIDETLTAWQYSSMGMVYGISGRVDINVWYGYAEGTPGTAQDSQPQESQPVQYDYNVIYRVRTRETGWLPEVVNDTDYAGWGGYAVTDVAIRTTTGYCRYRVHVYGGGWLPYVDSRNCNTGDAINGYAGNGRPIDAVEIYYYTPDGAVAYRYASYRVMVQGRSTYYSPQIDNLTTGGMDGCAGMFGRKITRLQISLVTR